MSERQDDAGGDEAGGDDSGDEAGGDDSGDEPKCERSSERKESWRREARVIELFTRRGVSRARASF